MVGLDNKYPHLFDRKKIPQVPGYKFFQFVNFSRLHRAAGSLGHPISIWLSLKHTHISRPYSKSRGMADDDDDDDDARSNALPQANPPSLRDIVVNFNSDWSKLETLFRSLERGDPVARSIMLKKSVYGRNKITSLLPDNFIELVARAIVKNPHIEELCVYGGEWMHECPHVAPKIVHAVQHSVSVKVFTFIVGVANHAADIIGLGHILDRAPDSGKKEGEEERVQNQHGVTRKSHIESLKLRIPKWAFDLGELRALCQSIQRDHTLRHLDLSLGSKEQHAEETVVVITQLMDALGHHSNLVHFGLKLDRVIIPSQCFPGLAGGLSKLVQHHPALRSLDVTVNLGAVNSQDFRCIKLMCVALGESKNLRVFQWQQLDAPSLKFGIGTWIGLAACKNKSLQAFSLHGTMLTRESLELLAKKLSFTCMWRSFKLIDVLRSTEELECIMTHGLEQNASLDSVKIYSAPGLSLQLDSAWAQRIAHFIGDTEVKKEKPLIHFSLWALNTWTETDWGRILCALERNHRLTKVSLGRQSAEYRMKGVGLRIRRVTERNKKYAKIQSTLLNGFWMNLRGKSCVSV